MDTVRNQFARCLFGLISVCVFLLVPQSAAAEPFVPVFVTGGTATANQPFAGSLQTIFAISGVDFRVDVTSFSGSARDLSRTELFPETPYTLGAFASSPFPGSITYQGIVYPISGSLFGPSFGGVTFDTASFQLPSTGQQFVDLRVPFAISGQVGFINSSTDRLIFDLSGIGTAIARASRVHITDQTAYEIREVNYVFGVTPTPTPEPVAVLLLASGLAMVVARRRAMHSTRPGRDGID